MHESCFMGKECRKSQKLLPLKMGPKRSCIKWLLLKKKILSFYMYLHFQLICIFSVLMPVKVEKTADYILQLYKYYRICIFIRLFIAIPVKF